MTVIMFDRDYTVDVNPHPSKDAVPLRVVKYLAHETDHPVFATGNQHLRREALIPGVEEARQIWEKINGYDPDDRYEDESYFDSYKPSRRNCIRLVKDIHPDYDEYLVIDDVDLSDLSDENIEWLMPWDAEPILRDRFDIPDEIESQDNQPENAKDNMVEDFLDEKEFIQGYA